MYLKAYLEKFSYSILLFSSFVFSVYGFSNLDIISEINKLFDGLNFVIYFLTIISVLYNVNRRNFYLPFLGNAVYPCGSLVIKEPKNASLTINLSDLSPNTNIIYWASEQSNFKEDTIIDTPWDAYDEFANTGVARSNENGNATVIIRPPIRYKIPIHKNIINKHLHYRECKGKGMLGPVKTLYI